MSKVKSGEDGAAHDRGRYDAFMSATIPFKTISGEDGSLTCEGATPTDTGPAGAVLRLTMAVLRKDESAIRKELVAMPEGGAPPGPPSTDGTVKIGEVTYETPEKAVVPSESTFGDQVQEMKFVVIKQGDAWKVDLNESIERMMALMMQAMQQGMEAMGQAMGEVMKGVSEGLSEAMRATAPDKDDDEDGHPKQMTNDK
jgi:hypothetical protein